ncbi:MAG TPA: M20/M25/M40 family metallo-hydrolase [Bacillota bacterium]|nr:M20/M25/M40 family metallo-hydrolase [Bacillota bacterium]
MIDKNRIYDNMKRMIEVPGVSGTDQEIRAAYKIQEILYEIPYFQAHKENVKMVPIEEDPFGRCIVTAYAECCPKSKKTVILTGHYDVVDVEEFGHLQDKAYDVEEITKRINEMPLDDDSRKDYESGEWIFGRGTADMKFGHALCIELLRHFSEEGGIDGNLLYVAVCGEETNSEGMLRAVPFFNEFAREHGAEYEALLLAECYMMEDQANDDSRYIHFGASGKVMPMFFFVGEATHGGEPFLGVDPNLMSAEVYRRLYMNPEFCQTAEGETTPPPVCLKNQDLKTTYSVSTPLYTASYYNIITVDLDPEAMMGKLIKIAEESFDASLKFIEEKSSQYEERFHIKPVRYPIKPCVKVFHQLYQEAKAAYAGDFDGYVKGLIKGWLEEKLELQDIAIKAVKRIYELSPDKRPMIIISIIPPYYPDVYPDKGDPKVKKLLRCVDGVIEYGREKYGEKLKLKNYYMGISDMCYTGLDSRKNFDRLFENVVGVNQMYSLPEEDLKKFSVPGIVLGGYGKDFHKHTERLNLHYNFDVLPDLYVHIIKDILE